MNMSCKPSAKKAFESTDKFLSPVLKRDAIQQQNGGSLIEKLGRPLRTKEIDELQERNVVLGKAISLLSDIQCAVSISQNDDLSLADLDVNDSALEDAKRRRLLHTLLDLISLEGIYPALSPGIGVPLEKRVIPTLPVGVIAKKIPLSEAESVMFSNLLKNIVDALLKIIFDTNPGIQPIIVARIQSDILSGLAELAFCDNDFESGQNDTYKIAFEKVMEATPTPILLPILSSFLRPEAAPWFHKIVSNRISRIPLRKDGVAQTILFVAAQFDPSLGPNEHGLSSKGPLITVQAIMQLSKLLSSVPEGIGSMSYFSNIGPQLLALIDGDDPDLKRTAAYIVSSGILGKKSFGAPGTVGHKIFIDPLFKTLTNELGESSRTWLFSSTELDKMQPDWNAQGKWVLVHSAELSRSVDRVCALTLQHPNPNLVKRLIQPVLLPLWGLLACAHESKNKTWHDKSFLLLQTYFGVSPGFQPLKKIVDNILWKGGDSWSYGLDDTQEICIRQSKKSSFNIVQFLESLESRVNDFSLLLKCDPQSEERIGDVFLYVSEQWLSPVSAQTRQIITIPLLKDEEDSGEIIRKLAIAKVTEKLLDDFKETLSRHPLRVLELVQQVLESELMRHTSQNSKYKKGHVKMSLNTLASIFDNPRNETSVDAQIDDSSEAISATLSLLSTLLAAPGFAPTASLCALLQSIKANVDSLLLNLPPSLVEPCTTASMLLEIHLTNPDGERELKNQTAPAQISDFEIHRQVLVDVNSSMPPVQAEGLSKLSQLITKSSPVLDIPSTLGLLLSLITDQNREVPANEEFIYLKAISLIGVLGSKHPLTVVRTLVDRYTDKTEESTVDQRLKIGESLMRTVQDLGEALTGESARMIGEGMISVAGRRGRKPQARQARLREEENERRQREHEGKEPFMPPGWKITSSASRPDEKKGKSNRLPEHDGDDNLDHETPVQEAHSARILSAWAAGSLADQEPDDLRVRASALSILATAIQVNLLALGPSIASSAVNLALSILSLELGPERAILRRASVVLLLDLIKAIDYARETRGADALGFGFSFSNSGSTSYGVQDASSNPPTTIGNIPTILRTLAFVECREIDSVVRGHLRVLVESFEAWMEKSLFWGISSHARARGGEQENSGSKLSLTGRIAGLNIDHIAGTDGGRKGRIIEEIE